MGDIIKSTSSSTSSQASSNPSSPVQGDVSKAASKGEGSTPAAKKVTGVISSATSISERSADAQPIPVAGSSAVAKLIKATVGAPSYLASAVIGAAIWAGSATGGDATKIISKLPKTLPSDWMGLPIEELDTLGIGNFLRLLTYGTKLPEKVKKMPPAVLEALTAISQMDLTTEQGSAIQKQIMRALGINALLTTASAVVGGLKTGKHSLSLIIKVIKYLGLLPKEVVDSLSSIKDRVRNQALIIVGPMLLYSLYCDLYNIMDSDQRTKALDELDQTPIGRLGDTTEITEDSYTSLVSYMKEYDPELYRLLKRSARFQSGTTLLANLGLDAMRVTSYVAGVLFADKKINEISLGTLANGLMIVTAVLSLMRYSYNQKSVQLERDTLQKWTALAPEVKNPSLSENAKENLRARERRQFIATGLLDLEYLAQLDISVDSFLTPSIQEYLEQSAKDKIPDYVRIREVTRLLQENIANNSQITPEDVDEEPKIKSKQINIIARCLVVRPEQYRTKKIARYFALIQDPATDRYRMRKDLERLLADKARAVAIKLDSKYAILRLYKKLSTLDLSEYPENHPIRRILDPNNSLFTAISNNEIDETAAKRVLESTLGF